MFGFVKPEQGTLLVKEYAFYKATYCGICRQMKAHTGVLSPMFLTYDSVFLALVRMVFEDKKQIGVRQGRCLAHPLKRRPMLLPCGATEYTAKVFALLSYYKMKDDLADEGALTRIGLLPARPVLAHARKKAKEYASLEAVIAEKLSEIGRLEQESCASVDTCAHPFGELLGALFSFGLTGADATVTRELGYRLGKFIYAADAAKDYEEDMKRGRFNPYVLSYQGQPLTEENKRVIRTALVLECTRMEAAVNLLDFRGSLTLEALIRNIIYNGLLNQLDFLEKSAPAPDSPGAID
ncbi:MAG: hypothetical protein J6J66_06540 [Clostridia bacterium]|nr:hypothetical protein [Clostridia bacterium]